jgi:hypothetical protein
MFVNVKQEEIENMERYRIENERRATINGRDCILFEAYELNDNEDAYVYCGQFTAPANTPDDKLSRFIIDDDDNEYE